MDNIEKAEIDMDGIFLIGGVLVVRAFRLHDKDNPANKNPWIEVIATGMPEREASTKLGLAGLRYRCIALMRDNNGIEYRHPFSLWRDGDKFFVERKIDVEPC